MNKENLIYTNLEPQNMNVNILQRNLGNCLKIIDEEVMKGYVTKLNQLPIVQQNEEVYDNLKLIHFFKISELVYQEDEFSVDKLAMVFQTLADKPCTLVLMLRSEGEKTEFYLGIRPNGNDSSSTMFQNLEQSLLGFFPGSQTEKYYDEEMEEDMQSMKIGGISCVTSVADYKNEQEIGSNKDFIQGLEKFVYTMQGKSYTAIFIADNVSYDELMNTKREYEQIYTQISPFSNIQMNFTISDGSSQSSSSSEGQTSNIAYTNTKGVSQNNTNSFSYTKGKSSNQGYADTTTETYANMTTKAEGTSNSQGISNSISESKTTTNGVNVGIEGTGASKSESSTIGKSHTNSTFNTVSETLSHGFTDSKGKSYSNNQSNGRNESYTGSYSVGNGTNESNAYTSGQAFNLVNTKAMTDTFGKSQGVTLNAQNMTLNLAMQRMQKHLERIEECESFGMWNFAAYFAGETIAEAQAAAETYKAVVAGTDSAIERNAINVWKDRESIQKLKPYLKHFVHPRFVYRGFSYDGEREIIVNPSALVSTNELAIHMAFPRHSVKGLPVVEHAVFGQEVLSRKSGSDEKINLGTIFHMGQKTETEVKLDLNSLTMHTLITGSTGSGKSNAVYHILNEVRRKGIPFLVIEPAKGEYKSVFKDIRCYGTNPLIGELLRINPFSFPKGIHVLEHIDRLIEIFNVCWPMYAAMPAVLKESVENAYKSAGWDLDISENEKVDNLFPTFDDVLRELNKTINKSEYSGDTKGDYIGSLSTRIRSLTNGINGRIFVSDEMNLQDLFDQSAIVDLSRVGSTETKSLIMGLLVMKLQEYRLDKAESMNEELKHVTVIEEAHNLLKKTSTEQSMDSSNMLGKSVEMLSNAIAEIRTYGEGFIIVDQAPNMLDTAAIRNTNTKIVLRLPENQDREITGKSIALKENQFDELSKLQTGVAAVYQNDWQEAVLCKLPKFESFDLGFMLKKGQKQETSLRKIKTYNDELLHWLIKDKIEDQNIECVKQRIMYSNVSAQIRKNLIMNLEYKNITYEWAVADFIKKNYDLSEIFRGTQKENWDSLEQLSEILIENIQWEFSGFSSEEMKVILYYVCRIEHELYPKYQVIEKLRVEYLREKVF